MSPVRTEGDVIKRHGNAFLKNIFCWKTKSVVLVVFSVFDFGKREGIVVERKRSGSSCVLLMFFI